MIQIKGEPFLTSNLNQVEIHGLTSLICILFAALFSYYSQNDKFNAMCFIWIMIADILYIIFAIRFLFLFRVFQLLKMKFLQKFEKFIPSIF